MKILYIADADAHSLTAGSVRGRAIKAFLESTYSLKYISLSVDRLSPENSHKTIIPRPGRLIDALKLAGINRSFRTIDSSMLRKSFYVKILHLIRYYSRNNKCDLIYCSYKPSAAIWLGVVAKIITKSALVVEYRDLMSAFGDRDISNVPRRLLNWIDHYVEAFLLKFIDHVIVVNETQRIELYTAFGRESTVIMNGIDGDIDYFKCDTIHYKSSRPVKIGYAGQLSKRRQLSCLSVIDGIYTLEIMSKESPFDYGLPLTVPCKEHGFLEKKEMSEVLVGCDCFLVIEGFSDSSKGNLPSKVFEYMKYGKPVLFSGNAESDVAIILKKVGLLILLRNDGTRVHLTNELQRVVNSFEPARLLEFSRSQQLKKLRGILDECIVCS